MYVHTYILTGDPAMRFMFSYSSRYLHVCVGTYLCLQPGVPEAPSSDLSPLLFDGSRQGKFHFLLLLNSPHTPGSSPLHRHVWVLPPVQLNWCSWTLQ